MSLIQQTIERSMSPQLQGGATVGSLLTLVAGWLDKIHGPAATVGVILGAVWVGLQIYLAVEKRWFNKG